MQRQTARNAAGAVSFHDPPAEPVEAIGMRIQIQPGPTSPPPVIQAFEDEMRGGHLDWERVLYGGARHAFTNPAAGNSPAGPAA